MYRCSEWQKSIKNKKKQDVRDADCVGDRNEPWLSIFIDKILNFDRRSEWKWPGDRNNTNREIVMNVKEISVTNVWRSKWKRQGVWNCVHVCSSLRDVEWPTRFSFILDLKKRKKSLYNRYDLLVNWTPNSQSSSLRSSGLFVWKIPLELHSEHPVFFIPITGH